MEVVKCSRCGAFYANTGYVCPKCTDKDNFEFSTFKTYIEENSAKIPSLSQISINTGITEKNLNRFLNYDGLTEYKKLFK